MSGWLIALSVFVMLRMVVTVSLSDDQIMTKLANPRDVRRKAIVWGVIYLFLLAMGAG